MMAFFRGGIIVGFICLTAAAEQRSVNALVPEDLRKDKKLVEIAIALDHGYGKDFGGVSRDTGGNIVMLFGRSEILYDDRKAKAFEEMLVDPDIEDSFCLIYPLTNPTDKLPKDFDPGRIRVEKMFKALYGATEREVAKSCVIVMFCGHQVRFSSRCGAALALEAVGKDLDVVLLKQPNLKIYVSELGGTFSWRLIAGTERLSNHSFGNAIDLNIKKSAYWRWSPPALMEKFSRKDWPVEIIEAFERHGFIWGGKWWHYDTMHFEFRPELIAHAKAVIR
jgi:hypothetical protein